MCAHSLVKLTTVTTLVQGLLTLNGNRQIQARDQNQFKLFVEPKESAVAGWALAVRRSRMVVAKSPGGRCRDETELDLTVSLQ